MTRAIGYHGPQAECDGCFEAAWWAEWDAASDPELLPHDTLDALADEARNNGQHPCTNHR